MHEHEHDSRKNILHGSISASCHYIHSGDGVTTP